MLYVQYRQDGHFKKYHSLPLNVLNLVKLCKEWTFLQLRFGLIILRAMFLQPADRLKRACVINEIIKLNHWGQYTHVFSNSEGVCCVPFMHFGFSQEGCVNQLTDLNNYYVISKIIHPKYKEDPALFSPRDWNLQGTNLVYDDVPKWKAIDWLSTKNQRKAKNLLNIKKMILQRF